MSCPDLPNNELWRPACQCSGCNQPAIFEAYRMLLCLECTVCFDLHHEVMGLEFDPGKPLLPPVLNRHNESKKCCPYCGWLYDAHMPKCTQCGRVPIRMLA